MTGYKTWYIGVSVTERYTGSILIPANLDGEAANDYAQTHLDEVEIDWTPIDFVSEEYDTFIHQ